MSIQDTGMEGICKPYEIHKNILKINHIQTFLEFSTSFDFSLYQIEMVTQKVDFLCMFEL